MNTKRQPAGVPVGGQFAASARSEADVSPQLALHDKIDSSVLKAKALLNAASTASQDSPDAHVRRTPAQLAYEVYRGFATQETTAAIDTVRAFGAKNGAAYVAFPYSDDYESDDQLSSYPEFYDEDGEDLELELSDDEDADDPVAAESVWTSADRSRTIIDGVVRDREGREALAVIHNAILPTDFVFRCTKES